MLGCTNRISIGKRNRYGSLLACSLYTASVRLLLWEKENNKIVTKKLLKIKKNLEQSSTILSYGLSFNILTRISTRTCMPTLMWWRIQYQSFPFIGTHLYKLLARCHKGGWPWKFNKLNHAKFPRNIKEFTHRGHNQCQQKHLDKD